MITFRNIALRLLAAVGALGVLAAVATSCGSEGAGGDKPVVTVSLPPQEYILGQIVGDAYTIRCLLTSESDPESYEPSVGDLRDAERSAALMVMGNIGFEKELAAKIRDANPQLPVIDCSEGIEPVTGTHGRGEADPHTWVSVRNVRTIAENMRDAMIAVDPGRRELFEANCARFVARVDSIDSAIAARLAPAKGSAFLVWHPSLSYFARDYGLPQIAIGGHEHKEPSIPELKERIDRAAASGARVMFLERGADRRNALSVADALSVEYLEIAPMAADWLGQLEAAADSLAKAAGGDGK